MKTKLLVLILNLTLCLTGTNSIAQETVKGLDEKKDLTTLNKILRRSARRLNAIENGVSLTSGVTGILPLANGGLGADLSGAVQGDILYHNGTTFINLAPGTSGQFLKTQGASANPIWANAGLVLKSTTSYSGAQTTGNITLSAGKTYKVYFRITNDAAAVGVGLILRFNAQSGASDYAWNRRVSTMAAATTTQTIDADEAHTDIPLGTIDNVEDAYMYGVINIDTNRLNPVSGTDRAAFVWAEYTYEDTSAVVTRAEVSGVFYNNGDVSSFAILNTANNTSGTIEVYEYN